ncbi:MAG: hypothetical protein A2664_00855 [Candidatus Taylorbacteria bacterium RIFCSPHIGHO2_01_FULL_46_22b]|uniref:Uncharacterized protein n=1 Tax=Candidatus Taylorbacteria bacterium RIFCSPHIGHO2_01_FULL_46_22b TaxID=1802301 RepID=A0A1G2M3M3_9BACT|nr:MAG: hypothetical protein A2664_00855 [Candidatus Taylorbacteria bacterium RIFCSPHIGHO2_01_FULL_46_22b]
MTEPTKLDHKRLLGFRAVLRPVLPIELNFAEEVEGRYLFLTYYGEHFHDVLEFSGRPPREDRGVTDTPRVGRYDIGDRESSSFSDGELQELYAWVAKTVAATQAQVEAAKAIVRARVAEGERNRQAEACELCKDMNSNPPRMPHGSDSPFTCTCGIRYVYDDRLRYWYRETQAQSDHKHEDMLFVLQYGEPNHCG